MNNPAESRAEPRRTTSVRIKSLAAEHWPIAVLVLATFLVCVANLARGHDWGDDFALYIGQAKAIAQFDLSPVVESNIYAIDNSAWRSFSPVAYPWGFPLLLAPFYGIWGVNFGVFQVMQCVFFALFVGLLARIFIVRVGRVAGILLAGLLGSSVVYIGWAQSVTADFPYLAFVALALLSRRPAAARRFSFSSIPWAAHRSWALSRFRGEHPPRGSRVVRRHSGGSNDCVVIGSPCRREGGPEAAISRAPLEADRSSARRRGRASRRLSGGLSRAVREHVSRDRNRTAEGECDLVSRCVGADHRADGYRRPEPTAGRVRGAGQMGFGHLRGHGDRRGDRAARQGMAGRTLHS